MSGTCVIPGCNRTRGQHFEDDGCTPLNFFSFKSACDTKIEDWIRATGRNDLTVNNCASKAICSMHFSPNDILGNRHTKGKLKYGAVPSRNLLFPSSENIKYTYYLVKDNVAGSGCSDNTCISPLPMLRVNSLEPGLGKKDEMGLEKTTTTSLHPIRNINSLVPRWHYEQRSGVTWYYQLSSTNNTPPKILRSIKVPSDGSFPEFYMGNEKWQRLRAKRLVRKALINRYIFHESGFVRVLTEFGKVPFAEVDLVQSVVNVLDSVLNDHSKEFGVVDDDKDKKVFLSFILEQLKMLSEKKSARRWSPDVMKWAASIYHHSTTAYRLLCGSGYLILPCQRRINGHYKAAGLQKPRSGNNLKDTLQCVV